MGYRSELVIAVPKKVRMDCLLDETWPKMLADQEPDYDRGDHQIWHFSGIKFYEGMFPEIDRLNEFLEEYSCPDDPEDEAVAALRMGEEFGDIWEWGCPGEFEIFATQSIDF